MKSKKLNCIIVTVIMIFLIFGLVGCSQKSSKYTEEEHIQRVTERVQKKYIDVNLVDKPTSFEVFPIYNENEELGFFLVEFEPYGFLFIQLRDERMKFFSWAGASTSMYKISAEGNYEWTSNDGETVYNRSPYFIAKIKNERRYLLLDYIVAVKREDEFLNLISQENFEIINGQATNEQAGIVLDFGWPKATNDL